MNTDNKEIQNKIKYSIWETRIAESQRKVIEKSPELTESFNLNTNKN
jgi:hypothetical protein